MLSYAHGTSTEPLLAETIGANLERTAARFPDADALVSCHQEATFTYAEFNGAVDALASGLLASGLRQGDRVGVWSPNRYEWALVQYATAKLGVILVNINPAYRVNELQYALAHSGCRWIFITQQFKGADFEDMVATVRDDLPALERVIVFGSEAWDALATERVDARAITARMAELDFDDPINIQYTSGTTGFPKGATLTHHNILNNGYFIGEVLRYTERDRVCIPVPLYHCFGMVIGNLAVTTHGACIVYPGGGIRPGGDPARMRRGALHEPVRSADDVHRQARASELRRARPELAAHRDHGRLAVPDRGDEAGRDRHGHRRDVDRVRDDRDITGHDDGRAIDETLEHRCATVGQAMAHVEVKIADPQTGHTLARGQTGEFQARGYPVMRGYWDDPERTAEAIDVGGWMHTGRPRDDGRGRLRPDRRAHQGHGHPRRRERLSARDRGVPLHPSGRSPTCR